MLRYVDIQKLFSLCLAPAARVQAICPDCSSHISMDNAEVQTTVSSSLEKFNKDSGLANHFALLNITRATAGVSSTPTPKYHVTYCVLSYSLYIVSCTHCQCREYGN